MIAAIHATDQRPPSAARLHLLFGAEVHAAAMTWLALCAVTGHAYRHGWREVSR